MNLKAQREAAQKELLAIKSKIDDGTVTDDDYTAVDTLTKTIEGLDVKIASAARMEQFLGAKAPEPDAGKKAPASLGDHFIAESGVKSGRARPACDVRCSRDRREGGDRHHRVARRRGASGDRD
jgi:hypothetical protein